MHEYKILTFLAAIISDFFFLFLHRESSSSGVINAGAPPAVGDQEARGQLLPQTLARLAVRYRDVV